MTLSDSSRSYSQQRPNAHRVRARAPGVARIVAFRPRLQPQYGRTRPAQASLCPHPRPLALVFTLVPLPLLRSFRMARDCCAPRVFGTKRSSLSEVAAAMCILRPTQGTIHGCEETMGEAMDAGRVRVKDRK
jgi:hypothetical protein